MLLASGRFDPIDVISAAVRMAKGETNVGPSPSESHPNGYGIVWRDSGTESGFGLLRGLEPLGEADAEKLAKRAGPSLHGTSLVAIHARHATLPEKLGFDFSHPLHANEQGEDWYFMHNGYLPTIHTRLGKQGSTFDSAEYFQAVRSLLPSDLSPERLAGVLDDLPEPTSSANMFLLSRARAIAFTWWPEQHEFKEFYTMRMLTGKHRTFLASDPLADLAPLDQWQRLERGTMMEISLG